MQTKKYLLIAILIIAAYLRLWNLGSIPPSLTPDEASLGYNAYSILKTGRDEYGKLLPIIFKSFGDYKPGLYIYLTVPSVAVFGLTEFATRLPSALAGILIVYLIYLIVRSLFTDHLPRRVKAGRSLATIATFVAATNPWLIYFSRGAWEVNVALALTLAGIYFFLRSLRNSSFIIHSSVAFGATLLAYQGAKLSTGIVVLLLVALYFKRVIKINLKKLIIAVVLGVLISFPILLSFIKGQTGRLTVFSIFSYHDSKEYLQKADYYFFHSEPLFFARGILGRYFNHFSGRFLFFEGDWSNPRHSAPNSGMFLLSDLIILLLGLIFIFRNHTLYTKPYTLILLWLLLAPLPSILSRDQVHAVRSINMVIPLIIIISIGLDNLVIWIKDQKFSGAFYVLLTTFYMLSFAYFVDSYFIHLPKHNSKLWGYGHREMVQKVTEIQAQYKTIKIQQSFLQPYIYFLFYQKYDPAKYQKQAKWSESEYKDDVGYVTKLDNIDFVGRIDWQISRGESGVLFVAGPSQIPPEDSKDEKLFKVISEIKYLDGKEIAFRIVEVL